MSITLLAIESSCDDTSAAVLRDGEVLSNCVANQEAHRLYGGVVPEVASRAHQVNIIPVVDLALKDAGVDKSELSAIAFTRGPGLLGSLIVGVSFAKALGLSLNIPLIEVHHMQAHILAHFAEDPKPAFPFLCLTVSGGHTQIVQVNSPFDMAVLGQTIDDAAGEAFDKTGKMLGLPYPSGPVIDQLAQKGTPKFDFPEPRIPGLDFSFSGLKTAILYYLQKQVRAEPDFVKDNLNDICASVQERIVTILLKKLRKASRQTGIKEIAIAGGVSANSGLRAGLKAMGGKEGWNTYIPAFEYCTDNAGMIAVAAYYKYLNGDFTSQSVQPAARLPQS
ncbi:tRNA (adenosine(37)-N6)-threonylcarbamoyltransferase complex transferase subunit TsaD [Phaeodactylibacter luteus]|uniref:tRNA N6-adenosine threonylcarbamoyltransferase n=1 Tax=Phaeodactylibacter luteus TaxID=1564516 RepID=A0A5C6S354_9BACT|nr:tRNA (adenosine(37)-N6)-threonylcarbamoyltransferase complex transferase subunit TsaD [Phaeodactylibacter luteus]TXB68928.1 tRNA (adenosine(37)-N6)-threonylcarbamoyltransferase complex transferase subunit TsaD [Phaeodactylibacter luteus]